MELLVELVLQNSQEHQEQELVSSFEILQKHLLQVLQLID